MAIPVHLGKLGIDVPKPVVERLANGARKIYEDLDAEGADLDPDVWQKDYKLLPHNVRVAIRLVAMGEMRGRDSESAIRYISGIWHDAGKSANKFKTYRLMRTLTSRERKRLTNGHPSESETLFLTNLRQVRPENQQFMLYARKPIRNHHKPWRIFMTWLRIIAWDLFIDDMFDSLTEPRANRRAYTTEEAFAKIPLIIEQKVPWIIRKFFAQEIDESFSILVKVESART